MVLAALHQVAAAAAVVDADAVVVEEKDGGLRSHCLAPGLWECPELQQDGELVILLQPWFFKVVRERDRINRKTFETINDHKTIFYQFQNS